MTDHSKTHSTERRLADIVRDVKIASADRTDVVVDMRDADRARLELLAQEVRPLLDDIDADDDRFDFGISSGLQPRLWIDSVAHVHMGRDRRMYRFVRDTRLGRVVISDSSDLGRTADAVARYIAERVIERERILSGDFEAMKASSGDHRSAGDEPDADGTGDDAADRDASATASAGTIAQDTSGQAARPAPIATLPEPAAQAPARATRGTGFVLGASWFILGCVAGAAALVGAFWDRLSAMIN